MKNLNQKLKEFNEHMPKLMDLAERFYKEGKEKDANVLTDAMILIFDSLSKEMVEHSKKPSLRKRVKKR